MSSVRFTREFSWPRLQAWQSTWRPTGGPAGDGVYTVTREVAAAAVKEGAAVRVKTPARAAAADLAGDA